MPVAPESRRLLFVHHRPTRGDTTTDSKQPNTSGRRPSPAAILPLPLVAALVLALFAWPSARQEPRDLPVAVTGPSAGVQAIERQLSTHDGAFDVRRYPG